MEENIKSEEMKISVFKFLSFVLQKHMPAPPCILFLNMHALWNVLMVNPTYTH